MNWTGLINPSIFAKRLLLRALLALLLSLSFRTFQFFPGMPYVQEAWFGLCLLMVIVAYPYLKVRNGLSFSWFEVYLIALIIFATSVAVWQARQVFGQPLIYGILSLRDVVLIGGWLVLVHLLRCGILNTAEFESVLLFLAWSTFALFGAMRVFLSPSNFLAYGEGFVTRPMVGVEPSFKLQEFFILFGVFYYALLGIRTGRTKYYLAALVLFPVTLGGSGRGIAVGVAATLLLCLYRIRRTWQATVAAIQFLSSFVVLFAVTFVLLPSIVTARVRSFSDAFSAIFTGSATQDPSANARILETLTAIPYIQTHPFLGNGVVSHQWQGGSQTALGAYFFASDIGIVGILFSFGAIGLLLYLWQYRIAWNAAKKAPLSLQGPFLDATKAFLLYSAIYSLESGICVWNANVTLFFVALLYGNSARATKP
jgi:hypothetical protein